MQDVIDQGKINMKDFGGKTAVVTGAGSGMGRAFAQRLAEQGMKVVLADVQVDALDRAVEELSQDGHEVIGVRTDVSSKEAIVALADEAIAAFGKIHVVCNNAGVEGYLDGTLWEATEKDWRWTFDVDFWSVAYGIQVFLPLMLSHGEEGHVVNTCSMTAVTRAGGMYGIAKHGVLAMSESLFRDLKERGTNIGVSAICPGIIATNLFRGSRNRPEELRNEVETPGAAKGRESRERMHARLAEGMSPFTVADIVVDAIRDDRLYVLTDHEWDARIEERHQNIMAGTNPVVAPA
jgi:NAD(P)-dependent dehydrogenase (short-subunit alcohol dehydrogenase family)